MFWLANKIIFRDKLKPHFPSGPYSNAWLVIMTKKIHTLFKVLKVFNNFLDDIGIIMYFLYGKKNSHIV